MKFEFVIHPQKSGVNFAFRDLCNMAVFSAMVVIPAFPIQRPAACFFSKSCTAEATVYFSVKCIMLPYMADSVFSSYFFQFLHRKECIGIDNWRMGIFCIILLSISLIFKPFYRKSVRRLSFLPEGISDIFFIGQDVPYCRIHPSVFGITTFDRYSCPV